MARAPYLHARPSARRIATLAIALSGVLAGAAVPGAAAQGPSDDKLGDADKARIDRAEAAGRDTVTLLVAAREGRVDDATAALEGLGGTVLARNRRVDYVKVEIATDQAARAARLRLVDAVDVDGTFRRDEPGTDGAQAPVPQTPPGAGTPRINPYLPTTDTKAAEFATTHPEWDGRGTKIAVLDSGIDLDHPALQTTTTGLPKIVDWYNANAVTSGDGTWVQMAGSFNGTFTSGGASWQAPPTGGPYAFGVFNEANGDLNSGEVQGDVDRDGTRGEAFGVLQDRTTKEVRVDLDQDGDFTDQTPMIDFKVKRDFQFFGADVPATPVVERMAFVVVTDRPDYVNIGIAGAQHGTHVAGITAANGLFGGRMSGAAPGAQLMAIKGCFTTSSCTNSGLIDGMLYAARNGADVLNISIGGLPALNDGNTARAELYDRTIAEFGMQIFISSGNSGAGANTVGDPSVTTTALSIGASITSATWRSNYGSIVSVPFAMMPFSSRGPREDGGFKPQLVAPGSAISTTPRWQGGGPVAGTYALPPGYSMLNGTSMASPQATGAAALLISAYKATFGGARPEQGPRPAPSALRSALVDSAVFKGGIGAYEQGAGLIQVNEAWRKLADKPAPHAVTAKVPVDTSFEQLFREPGVGVGIHDRENVRVGQPYTRTYTLRRTSGPAGPVSFTVQWVTSDGGVFSSAKTLTLPLNADVAFPVKVNPSKAGVSSAILKLDDRATKGVDVVTLNTVFAPAEFTAASGYTARLSGKVARNDTQHLFVRVPEGTSALKVDLTSGGGAAAGAGQVRFLRFSPYGVNVDPTGSTTCYDPDAGGGCPGGGARSRTVVDPLPGVWEVVVEARRTSDVLQAPFTVEASVLGAQVSPDPDVIPSATLGQPIARTYTVTNSLAPATARLEGGTLGSTRTLRSTIADGAQEIRDVVVTAGAAAVEVRIGGTSDPKADLDLAVFNCTTGTCVLAGQSADGDSEEAVRIANPAAGLWRTVVQGFAVPAGSTEYSYEDRFESGSFGSVAVTDAFVLRPAGATWTVSGLVTPQALPGPGRTLTAQLRVVTDAGAVIGTSRVEIQQVTG